MEGNMGSRGQWGILHTGSWVLLSPYRGTSIYGQVGLFQAAPVSTLNFEITLHSKHLKAAGQWFPAGTGLVPRGCPPASPDSQSPWRRWARWWSSAVLWAWWQQQATPGWNCWGVSWSQEAPWPWSAAWMAGIGRRSLQSIPFGERSRDRVRSWWAEGTSLEWFVLNLATCS